MTELEKFRKVIDEIDEELAALYLKRLAAIENIARIKFAAKMPTEDPEREKTVICRLTAGIDRASAKKIADLYAFIFAESRKAQDEFR